ncbi:hypothetical protein [Maribacter hydrothermalis]|uniref:SnoaL-like domain-containing protein n=1 Tax=Maribacter hydrothermalis TaxID=1836467 RepID=A0A1B7ZEU9_9FLAO|nr:hypothetical protein [Maribacter hydrothermalis]APQ17625.1 hypothetical protein BTR34_09910 [Maribacter hydrothermalis]OBR42099.1 hypothetical protein A9200_01540 [Maribacter hydrothermalis]
MKNTFVILFLIGLLCACSNEKLSHKEAIAIYYKAFDSGDYNKITAVVHDSITMVSGDFVTTFNKDSFYEFYKWDSIFKPTYELLEIEEKNKEIIAIISQNNIRNEFLKNNPLKLNVKVTLTSDKIAKLEELDYIDVNWNIWAQRRDSLVGWIKINHPELDGFVNDISKKGAMNYLQAIKMYENRE